MCKFSNQMLDDLNELYPVFKKQLRRTNQSKGPQFSSPKILSS